MYLAKIFITLKKSILDPQGKAVHHAMQNLKLSGIEEVRIGKFIEIKINSKNKDEAQKITEEACKKLLANPVMENFTFSIEELLT